MYLELEKGGVCERSSVYMREVWIQISEGVRVCTQEERYTHSLRGSYDYSTYPHGAPMREA